MDLHIHKLLADGGKVAIELPVGEPDLLSLLVVQHGECVLHLRLCCRKHISPPREILAFPVLLGAPASCLASPSASNLKSKTAYKAHLGSGPVELAADGDGLDLDGQESLSTPSGG